MNIKRSKASLAGVIGVSMTKSVMKVEEGDEMIGLTDDKSSMFTSTVEEFEPRCRVEKTDKNGNTWTVEAPTAEEVIKILKVIK